MQDLNQYRLNQLENNQKELNNKVESQFAEIKLLLQKNERELAEIKSVLLETERRQDFKIRQWRVAVAAIGIGSSLITTIVLKLVFK